MIDIARAYDLKKAVIKCELEHDPESPLLTADKRPTTFREDRIRSNPLLPLFAATASCNKLLSENSPK